MESIIDTELPQEALLPFLSPVARRIVDLIGFELASKFFAELGGLHWQFVSREKDMGARRFNRLVNIIGEEAADILTGEFRGEWITVPNCRIALKTARSARRALAMQKRYDEGATTEQLAIEFGCSSRWVEISLKKDVSAIADLCKDPDKEPIRREQE